MKQNLDRRAFLGRLGRFSAGAAALSRISNQPARAFYPPSAAGRDAAAWALPPRLTNPNILLIMVDQLRSPAWLNSSQSSTLAQKYLPNIFGRIRNKSYNFQQYYVAATVCTPSRATLLTGLYAPQTAMYLTSNACGSNIASPDLNPAFPTWGGTLAGANPAYDNNCWWFGKWHLSVCDTPDPLRPYGFNTRTYPGGASANASPDGSPNEGTNGGSFQNYVYANDSQIAGDFIGWLQGQAPSSGPPSSPWCATVSFVNPHDISAAPAWLQEPFPPPGLPLPPFYFPPPAFPPAGGPPALYTSLPSPWNYENLQKVTGKPSLHAAYRDLVNRRFGAVTDWVKFLNQYYWLQYYVDRQVGAVLDALDNSGQAGNTVVIFTSDHGEYAGSHGLHGKGFAAYEESIHVPFYVRFPGQTACIPMSQMCSSVDFFGLICDLGTGGTANWRQLCPDLASRQSFWSFLYQNAPETRIGANLGVPYVLHTSDSDGLSVDNSHIVCLRTKTDSNNTAQPGGKLAVYSAWADCTTIPDGTPPEYEFYDYNPATANNNRETGNDYFSSNAVTRGTIAQYQAELGDWGPLASGLIASELNPALTGNGTDGLPLSAAQTEARTAYFDASAGSGTCTAG